MRNCLFISLIIIYSAAAYANVSIQGGEPVLPTDPLYSFTIALGHSKGDRHNFCTGVLVAEGRVITAAHCIHPEYSDYVIRFGSDATRPIAERRVTHSLVHSDFSDNDFRQPHDIAILYFEGGLPTGYTPAKLYEDDALIPLNTPIQFGGYGRSHSNQLYWVSLPLISIDSNILQFENSTRGGPCSGDSGGPAIFADQGTSWVVGIDQAGSYDHFGCEGWLGYTRIDINLSWIRQNL